MKGKGDEMRKYTMNDLAGREAKLSPRTITIKDADGKTCGIIRGLQRYVDMPLRDQVEYRRTVGLLWGNKHGLTADRVYFDGKHWYYIYNTRLDRYPDENYAERMADLDRAQVNGIDVIRVAAVL